MYASPELGGPSQGPLALRTRSGLLGRLGATSLRIGHPRAYGRISADMRSDFFGHVAPRYSLRASPATQPPRCYLLDRSGLPYLPPLGLRQNF